MGKLTFARLPEEVQDAVITILLHRKQILRNAVIGGITTSVPLSLIGGIIAVESLQKSAVGIPNTREILAGLGLGAAFAVAGYGIYRGHDFQFRREFLALFRAIREHSNPRLDAILQEPSAHYLVVDPNGNLVTKKTAPNILKQPFGRRRVPNPRNPRIVRAWRRRYLPR